MSGSIGLSAWSSRPTVRRGLAVAGLVVVVAATVVIVRGRKVDDAALESALVGTWTAVDPNDASLHRREWPVAQEQFIVRSDKTLTHLIEPASQPGNPEKDLWAWKVNKGRLYIRFLEEDATGQWLPGLKFSVSDKTLSLYIKGYPPKKWVRH